MRFYYTTWKEYIKALNKHSSSLAIQNYSNTSAHSTQFLHYL